MSLKARLFPESEERDYLQRRAIEEEKAALASRSLKARCVHEELARLYRARAAAAGLPTGDFWTAANAAA